MAKFQYTEEQVENLYQRKRNIQKAMKKKAVLQAKLELAQATLLFEMDDLGKYLHSIDGRDYDPTI